MLRGVIICPDGELRESLENALASTRIVGIARKLDHYPNMVDLVRFLRAAAPEVVFLSVESHTAAVEVAQRIEEQAPGTCVVAADRTCDSSTLLEIMHSGIREFISPPFDLDNLRQMLRRIHETLERKPPKVSSTEALFAFLPSKAGVGCSTIALNTAVALSKMPQTKVLLADFDLNSGIIGFMLQLDSQYSITQAAESALDLDEHVWPKLVCPVGGLDVIPSGKLKPGFRIEPAQTRHLVEFARRHYQAICVDLSGMMEKYSVEILHEAKRILLVCTAEIPALHLAREKVSYLRTLELDGRVSILVNRSHKRGQIDVPEIEKLLGFPVFMQFPNDYLAVHTAVAAGKPVDLSSELGQRFQQLAQSMSSGRGPAPAQKRSWLDMVMPRKKADLAPAAAGPEI